MVVGKIVRYVVDRTGAKLIPGAYKAFRQYDVRITNQLFGKSGGKGFRHGRDLGLIASEFIGDDLDEFPTQRDEPKYSSRSKYKTYSRYKRRNNCRCPKRYSFN